MATDILFNFYELFVENIFGSIGVAIVGIYLTIFVIMVITRSTQTFIVYWTMFYFMVMGTFYIGALGLVITFLLVSAITTYNWIKLQGREG